MLSDCPIPDEAEEIVATLRLVSKAISVEVLEVHYKQTKLRYLITCEHLSNTVFRRPVDIQLLQDIEISVCLFSSYFGEFPALAKSIMQQYAGLVALQIFSYVVGLRQVI